MSPEVHQVSLEEEDSGRLETDAQRRRDRKTRRGWSDAASGQGTSGQRSLPRSLRKQLGLQAPRPCPSGLQSRGRVRLCGLATWLVVVCHDNLRTLRHRPAEAWTGRPGARGTWGGPGEEGADQEAGLARVQAPQLTWPGGTCPLAGPKGWVWYRVGGGCHPRLGSERQGWKRALLH